MLSLEKRISSFFIVWDVPDGREAGACGWFHSSLLRHWKQSPVVTETTEHPRHQPDSLDRGVRVGLSPNKTQDKADVLWTWSSPGASSCHCWEVPGWQLMTG